MKDLSQPLYSLTVGEYIDLSKQIFSNEGEKLINNFNKNSANNNLGNDIIFIEEVEKLTDYRKSTIYSKVCRFEMPVISRRSPLTFSRKAIIDWLKDGKPSVLDQEANDYLSKT